MEISMPTHAGVVAMLRGCDEGVVFRQEASRPAPMDTTKYWPGRLLEAPVQSSCFTYGTWFWKPESSGASENNKGHPLRTNGLRLVATPQKTIWNAEHQLEDDTDIRVLHAHPGIAVTDEDEPSKTADTEFEQIEENAHTAVAALAVQESARRERAREPLLIPPAGLSETFRPERWLTDASITHGYLWLCDEYAWLRESIGPQPPGARWTCHALSDSDGLQKQLPDSVLLLDPAVAFWLTAEKHAEHIAEAILGLKLREKELVLCPINDSVEYGACDTGTHWTLLAIWIEGSRDRNPVVENDAASSHTFGETAHFFYYDSLGGARASRRNFTKSIELASLLAGRNVNPAEIVLGSCALQTNDYDCGMYVLMYTELIAYAFAQALEHDIDVVADAPCEHLQGSGSFRSWPSQIGGAVWDQFLQLVTPQQVASRRAYYRDVFGVRSMRL